MSDLKVKNPFAFPVAWPEPNSPEPGMTLRDWFAGQALSGLLAHTSGEDPRKAPAFAYDLADMMLAQRTKDAGDE